MQFSSENEMTTRVLSGDQQAFEQMYRLLFNRLVAFSLGFTDQTEDAEDIVQQSMVKLWTLIANGEASHIQSVRTFLYQMVRNACLDYVRHQSFMHEHFIRVEDEAICDSLYQWDFQPSIEQETIYHELQEQVQTLITQLPDRQREVFLLSRQQQLSNREIAAKLGISIKAVEKNITAALKSLGRVKTFLIVLILITIKYGL